MGNEELALFLKFSASALTGLGVLTLVILKWKGKKLLRWLLDVHEVTEEESDDSDEGGPHYRRRGDRLLSEFIRINREQTQILEKLSANQDNIAGLIEKDLNKTTEMLDLLKAMTLRVNELYDRMRRQR